MATDDVKLTSEGVSFALMIISHGGIVLTGQSDRLSNYFVNAVSLSPGDVVFATSKLKKMAEWVLKIKHRDKVKVNIKI